MSNEKCTLSNELLIAKAKDWVNKLAKTGGSAWTLQVPVNFNSDPDMLFIELCNRLESTPSIQQGGQQEGVQIILDLFDRFMPKDVAVDDRKQMAMYEAYHRIKQLTALPAVSGGWVKATRERIPVGMQGDVVGDFFSTIPHDEKAIATVKHFENSDTQLSLMWRDNKVVAFVIETRTEFNNLEFIKGVTNSNADNGEDAVAKYLGFCHFIGEKGYKINGYDDGQLTTVINQFIQSKSK